MPHETTRAKKKRRGTTLFRIAAAALPGGIVLGLGIGLALDVPAIGVAVGAGFGFGITVVVFAAAIVSRAGDPEL